MDLKIFDIMLKDAVVRAATQFPKAERSEIVSGLQARSSYLSRVLAADKATQIAVRNAARLDTRPFAQVVYDFLNVWLSAECTGILPITRLVAPVTLPSAIVAVNDTRDFPESGDLVINATNFSQIISYTGKQQGLDFGTFTGCTQQGGYTGNSGQGAVARYLPDVDLSTAAVQARRATILAAFARRSQNTIGALGYINDQHIWEWDPNL